MKTGVHWLVFALRAGKDTLTPALSHRGRGGKTEKSGPGPLPSEGEGEEGEQRTGVEGGTTDD